MAWLSPCQGEPVAVPLAVAALLFIVWLGKCFSKWDVGSCCVLQHGKCIEQGVCWILALHCTFSAVHKGQTLERLPKISLSGKAGCGMLLGWTFNFKLHF